MNALKLTAIALLLSTAACAGRSPAPVLMTQAQDNTSSCAAMRAEIATNNEKRADLSSEHAGKIRPERRRRAGRRVHLAGAIRRWMCKTAADIREQCPRGAQPLPGEAGGRALSARDRNGCAGPAQPAADRQD